MDLNIQFFKCNGCGTLIYPPASISVRGERNIIKTFKTSQNSLADAALAELQALAKDLAVPVSKNAAKITAETEIRVEAERYESIVEGEGNLGRAKCPNCGFVLVTWQAAHSFTDLAA